MHGYLSKGLSDSIINCVRFMISDRDSKARIMVLNGISAHILINITHINHYNIRIHNEFCRIVCLMRSTYEPKRAFQRDI